MRLGERLVQDRPPADTAVVLRGVTRLFGALPGLVRASLRVERGETIWLCGPNGSGKSTLLRVIATALSPTFGEGTVLGHDLVGARAKIRARTDLLGHHARLYEDLTAAENLRFTCAMHGLDPAGIDAALDSVGMAEVTHVRTGGFSQGMRQRLALARCRLRDPDLLLLDEPYAGLDVDARVVVDDLLAGARERGRTILLASHEPPPPALIDRTVTIDGGRILVDSLSTNGTAVR
ncbi:MAG TPA: ABC transporter ATP-binding protein [Pseudonocardiaceae bacterium]|jgi:ABC-type multidrug transport system ATPase subunit